MRRAAATADFGTHHEHATVLVQRNVLFVERLEETRPAGAGIEFRRRIEQRLSAANAAINAIRMVVPVFILEGRFRALAARYLELQVGKLRTPFLLAVVDLFRHRCSCSFLFATQAPEPTGQKDEQYHSQHCECPASAHRITLVHCRRERSLSTTSNLAGMPRSIAASDFVAESIELDQHHVLTGDEGMAAGHPDCAEWPPQFGLPDDFPGAVVFLDQAV